MVAGFDPRAALDWAGKDWRADHGNVATAILRVWAREDPSAALVAAEAEQRQGLRRLRMEAVLRGWEEGGQPGAFEFALGLPGNYGLRTQAATIRRRIAREGVEPTLAWFDALEGPIDQTKKNLMQRLASAAAEEDPEKAVAWAAPYNGEEHGADCPTGSRLAG